MGWTDWIDNASARDSTSATGQSRRTSNVRQLRPSADSSWLTIVSAPHAVDAVEIPGVFADGRNEMKAYSRRKLLHLLRLHSSRIV